MELGFMRGILLRIVSTTIIFVALVCLGYDTLAREVG